MRDPSTEPATQSPDRVSSDKPVLRPGRLSFVGGNPCRAEGCAKTFASSAKRRRHEVTQHETRVVTAMVAVLVVLLVALSSPFGAQHQNIVAAVSVLDAGERHAGELPSAAKTVGVEQTTGGVEPVNEPASEQKPTVGAQNDSLKEPARAPVTALGFGPADESDDERFDEPEFEPPTFEPPEPCEHGLEGGCPVCAEAAEAYAELLPGEPGRVRVSAAEIDAGRAEFEYLRRHGPGSGAVFLAAPDAGEIDRAQGLAGLSLLDLLDRTVIASGRNADDHRATGRLALFAILAGVANKINQTEGRTYSWFENGQPRWLGTHVVLIARKRRGKGNELETVAEVYERAYGGVGHVVRVIRATMPGVFGGIDDRRKQKEEKGEQDIAHADRKTDPKPIVVSGKVQEAADGVLVFPEFSSIMGLTSGPSGPEYAATISEHLSSGRFEADFLKGKHRYQSFETWIGAIQPDLWADVNAAVLGIESRLLFGALSPLTQEQEAQRLLDGTEGHPLDRLALEVFGARFQRLRHELSNPGAGFPKPTLDVSAVERRLAEFVEHPPAGGMLFGADDLQRWVAVAFGHYLATNGTVAGNIVLPDPWEAPVLREVLEADARVRHAFRVDPGERLVVEIDSLLGTSGYMGDRTAPVARPMMDICAYAAFRLGAAPSRLREVVAGYRGRSIYDSFEARGILERAPVDPEFQAAWRVAYDEHTAAVKGAALRETVVFSPDAEAERRLGRKKRGRPAALWVYVWPENRFHLPPERR